MEPGRLDHVNIRTAQRDEVPEFPVVQVNLRHPDGNHIHIDFDIAEMADLD